MNTSETRRLEAVACGRAWADEAARRLRGQVPAEQWPASWVDDANGPLPGDTNGAEALRLSMTASRAAHERWRELLVEQRAAEALAHEQQRLEAQAWPRARDGRSSSRGG